MAASMLIAGGTASESRSIIMMDLYTDIQHNFSANVSSYTVESGLSASDNMVLNNPQFSFGGWVSNSPIAGFTGSVDETDPHRPQSMYNKIMNLYRSRIPFTFVTSFETFNNCVFTSISIQEGEAMGGYQVLQLNAQVQQIKVFASQKLLFGVAVKDKLYDQAKSNGGYVATEPAETQDAVVLYPSLLGFAKFAVDLFSDYWSQ